MNRELTPETIGAPSANYALATLSEGPGRILHTSGIGPVRPDGTVPEDIASQAATVWSTLLALLEEADLAVTDVVSVTTYVVMPPSSGSGDGAETGVDETGGEGSELGARLAQAMAARDASLNGHRCASILVPVPALATPSWKMEIAIVAAAD